MTIGTLSSSKLSICVIRYLIRQFLYLHDLGLSSSNFSTGPEKSPYFAEANLPNLSSWLCHGTRRLNPVLMRCASFLLRTSLGFPAWYSLNRPCRWRFWWPRRGQSSHHSFFSWQSFWWFFVCFVFAIDYSPIFYDSYYSSLRALIENLVTVDPMKVGASRGGQPHFPKISDGQLAEIEIMIDLWVKYPVCCCFADFESGTAFSVYY